MRPTWWTFRAWARTQPTSTRPIRRRTRLLLEQLEDRLTPATFEVTNLNDSGVGSLREAIGFANDEGNNPGADTIVFQSGLSGTINLSTPGDSTFGPTAFLISSDITIDGFAGGGSITLQRQAAVTNLRLFRVASGASLSLDGLTLKDGKVTGFAGGDGGYGGGGGGGAGFGGAIYSEGTLNVTRSLFRGNRAIGGKGGGVPDVTSGGAGGGGLGGAGSNPSGSTGGAGGANGGGAGGNFGGGNGAIGGFGGGGGGGGASLGQAGNGGMGGFGGGGGGAGVNGDVAQNGAAGAGGFGGGGGGAVQSNTGGVGGGGAGMGGGIFSNGGSLTITNSTFFDNYAQGGAKGTLFGGTAGATNGLGYGGAVFTRNGTAAYVNNTFSNNVANDGGAVYDLADGATLNTTLHNSILANSVTAANDYVRGTLNGGSLNSTTSNLVIELSSGVTGVVSSADPGLAALQSNGGPTQTMAITASSNAFNAGSAAAAAGLTTDQRGGGFARTAGAAVDIGAFELADLPDVTVAVAPASRTEGAGNLLYTFTRTGDTSQTLTLNFTIGGTATVNTDYTLSGTASFNSGTLSGTLSMVSGSTTAVLTVMTTSDSLVEANESVVVTLAAGTGYDVASPSSASATITDNDSATVSVAKITDGAETSTPSNGKFRVTLTQASSTATVVGYTVGGSATSGSDFSALSGSVSIPAGSTTADIDVTVLNDNVVEGTETVSVTLTGITSGDADITVDGANNTASLDVTDNDTATVSVARISDGAESDTPTNGRFRVTLSKASSTATVVSYTVGGSATSTSDYTALSGSVTIPAGSTTADIDVAVLNDNLVEGTETVSVALTGITSGDADITVDGANSTASLDVTDNDTATVSVAKISDGAETSTPANGLFRVTLSQVSSTATIVSYTVGGSATSGSDYTALSDSVSIPAGSTTADIDVAVLNDNVVEATETVSVTLTGITSGDADITVDGANNTASLDVTDDDTASVSVARISDGAESDTPTNGQFRVTLSKAASTATVITYTVGGSAGAGSDYTALSGSVSIPAGSTTADIDVAVLNDNLVEGTETVSVALTGITSGDADITVDGANSTASLDVTDNDTATVSVARISDGAESDTPTNGQFRVTLSKAASTVTVVSYTVGGSATSTSDYTALSGSVSIPAGSTTADIDVTVLNDNLVEGTETVSVALTGITSGDADITVDGANNTASLDVTDNDTATVSVAKISDGAETGTPANGLFRVTLSQVSSTATIVSYTVGGSATSGSDYTALSGSVSIPAGSTTADIDVAVLNDNVVEATESVSVTLTGITSGDADVTVAGVNNTASLDVTDNDTTTAAVVRASDGAEADTPTNGRFQATLGQPSSTATVVSYSISGSATAGDDHTALSGTVTIPAGSTSANIDVAVLNDNVVEGTESVQVTLTGVTSGDTDINVDGTSATASLNILDDDTATVTVARISDGAETDTPTDGKFRVTLSKASSTATVIAYTVGGSAASGSDFSALSGSVSVPAGSTTADIDVTVLNDEVVEGTETVSVTLTGITSGDADISVDGTNGAASLNITDDDTTTVSVGDVNDAAEGAMLVTGLFQVELGLASSTPTVISYTVTGSATPGGDYTTLSGTVTIPAGEQTADIQVVPFNDDEVEGTETVTVTLTGVTSGDADVTIDPVDFAATLNVIDGTPPKVSQQAVNWLHQVYLDVLGRRPNTAEAEAGVAQLAAGANRAAVVLDILNAQAALAAGKKLGLGFNRPNLHRILARELFRRLLGRVPGPRIVKRFGMLLDQGVTVEPVAGMILGRVGPGNNRSMFRFNDVNFNRQPTPEEVQLGRRQRALIAEVLGSDSYFVAI